MPLFAVLQRTPGEQPMNQIVQNNIKLYPLASNSVLKIPVDRPSWKELAYFKLSGKNYYSHKDHTLMTIKTGEVRAPKAGEWYISGAEPEAYKAKGDFKDTNKKPIAKLVLTKRRSITLITVTGV